MRKMIYIENDAKDMFTTKSILSRFKNPNYYYRKYSEVFNKKIKTLRLEN